MNRTEFEERMDKVSDQVRNQMVAAMKYSEKYMELMEKRDHVYELIEDYKAKGRAVPETFVKLLESMDKQINKMVQVMDKMSKEIDKNLVFLDKMQNYFVKSAEKAMDEYLKEQENKLKEQEKKLDKKINNLFKRK